MAIGFRAFGSSEFAVVLLAAAAACSFAVDLVRLALVVEACRLTYSSDLLACCAFRFLLVD